MWLLYNNEYRILLLGTFILGTTWPCSFIRLLFFRYNIVAVCNVFRFSRCHHIINRNTQHTDDRYAQEKHAEHKGGVAYAIKLKIKIFTLILHIFLSPQLKNRTKHDISSTNTFLYEEVYIVIFLLNLKNMPKYNENIVIDFTHKRCIIIDKKKILHSPLKSFITDGSEKCSFV